MQDVGLEQKSRRLRSKEEISGELGDCAMLETRRQGIKNCPSQVEIDVTPDVTETLPGAAESANPKSAPPRITGPMNLAGAREMFRDAADAPIPQSTVANVSEPNKNLAIDTQLQLEMSGCTQDVMFPNSAYQPANRVTPSSVHLIEPDKVSSLSDDSSILESFSSIKRKSNLGVAENMLLADDQATKV